MPLFLIVFSLEMVSWWVVTATCYLMALVLAICAFRYVSSNTQWTTPTADHVQYTVDHWLADRVQYTVDQWPADRVQYTVDQWPADHVQYTVDQWPADHVQYTVDQWPADRVQYTVDQWSADRVQYTVRASARQSERSLSTTRKHELE